MSLGSTVIDPVLLESYLQILAVCLKFEGSQDPATWNTCLSCIRQPRPISWALCSHRPKVRSVRLLKELLRSKPPLC